MQLLQRYCEALDQKDYDLLSEVFQPEARLSYSMDIEGSAPFVSPSDMVQAFRDFNQVFYVTQHLLGPPLIEVRGDAACSTTSLRAMHVQRSRDGQKNKWLVYGTYRDQHTRMASGWRIAERQFRALYTDGELLPVEQVETFQKPPWCWR